jgi:lariat debranching enzyme
MESTNNINSSSNIKTVRIAVVGCLHGHLKDVYDEIKANENKTGKKVDILLCCGDFESVRNKEDLKFKSCPEKYNHMGQFQYYYMTKTVAPILTVFVGGNHEASNVLDENFYGGWLWTNIFYLGRAGVIKYKGMRIAGLSGIYNKFDYYRGHFELDLIKNIKSIFHTREFEIAKMSYLTENSIDIFMSHDWPTGNINPNDIPKILSTHKRWEEEIYSDTLGSPASGFLLKLLKPKYWLSGHMHYTYFNDIKHNDKNNSVTKFIALDKSGTKEKRQYLHIFDYTLPEDVKDEDLKDNSIYFDEEWMAISKTFNPYIPLSPDKSNFCNFFQNKTQYINAMLDNYSYNWRKTQNNFYPDKDFLTNLQIYKKDFTQFVAESGCNIKWDFMIGEIQRQFVLKLIGIEDYHKYKTKKLEIFKNEIDDTGKSKVKDDCGLIFY